MVPHRGKPRTSKIFTTTTFFLELLAHNKASITTDSKIQLLVVLKLVRLMHKALPKLGWRVNSTIQTLSITSSTPEALSPGWKVDLRLIPPKAL